MGTALAQGSAALAEPSLRPLGGTGSRGAGAARSAPLTCLSLLQQAEQLGREDQQRLHRNRKLVLMVDLDQTLIHTTEQHCQHMSNKVGGTFPGVLVCGQPFCNVGLLWARVLLLQPCGF